MRNNRTYEAFTLVEMLIVMGIIIVLMGVGITAGRFAINRANDVAHQNAVDNLYQAAQAYYTDNREFPTILDFDAVMDSSCDPSLADCLTDYTESGEFDGGTEATFYYWVDSDDQQLVMICVALGGEDDEKGRGFYCNGNDFGASSTLGLTDKSFEYPASAAFPASGFDFAQPWDTDSAPNTWGTANTSPADITAPV